MLGGSKKQTVVGLLICAMLLALTGAVVGCLCGNILSDVVGEHLMSSRLAKSTEDAEFRAFILAEQGSTEQIVTGTDVVLSIMAGLCGAALFVAWIVVFVCAYINHEPRELLPKSKA